MQSARRRKPAGEADADETSTVEASPEVHPAKVQPLEEEARSVVPPPTQPGLASQPRARSQGAIWVAAALAAVLASLIFLGVSYSRSSQAIFQPHELAKYGTNSTSGRMYLSLLGQVFDVTKGKQHYGKGGGYSFFTGRDASRAFITGKFKDDLSDDVSDLTNEQCQGLVEWRGFYHRNYTYKGVVVGAFYDGAGHPTQALKDVEDKAAMAKVEAAAKKALEKAQPGCNMRWSAAQGGSVWCDNGWYPRKVTENLPGGRPSTRCACYEELGWSDIRQVYPSCAPDATECQTAPPEQPT